MKCKRIELNWIRSGKKIRAYDALKNDIDLNRWASFLEYNDDAVVKFRVDYSLHEINIQFGRNERNHYYRFQSELLSSLEDKRNELLNNSVEIHRRTCHNSPMAKNTLNWWLNQILARQERATLMAWFNVRYHIFTTFCFFLYLNQAVNLSFDVWHVPIACNKILSKLWHIKFVMA